MAVVCVSTNTKWILVTLDKVKPKIMMLGDYGRTKDRSIIKAEGISKIRQLYPNRFTQTTQQKNKQNMYTMQKPKSLPK